LSLFKETEENKKVSLPTTPKQVKEHKKPHKNKNIKHYKPNKNDKIF
jgi:hypothetical protein